jgi:Cdc6-like AAA superfamily ATPase
MDLSSDTHFSRAFTTERVGDTPRSSHLYHIAMANRKNKSQLLALISKTFTPAAPVSSFDAFAGRADEIMNVLGVFPEPSKHIALYGERGVGKTSLANVLSDVVTFTEGETRPLSVRINCTTSDKFRSIWSKVLRELRMEIPTEWGYGNPDPDDIRFLLADIQPPKLVILDEFDRVEDDDALSLMADVIKALSDHAVETKLVIVGVADSIDQLIGEHASIQRAIAEIHLQRMNEVDSRKIITSGLHKVALRMDHHAQNRIVRLAEGLPHYVHLLAQGACKRAVSDDRDSVTIEDVESAIDDAVHKHSLVKEYQDAVQSPRRNTLFPQVLAACALAEKNLLGQFTPSSVREPLTRLMGKKYEIQAFSAHLKSFSEPDRGSVLKREGAARKYTYRFRNPLLQPFSVMTALAENLIPDDYKRELFG